jgi:hypothetical protein
MVSPPDKNQGGVGSVFGGDRVVAGFARDGNAIGFCSAALFDEPPGQQQLTCAHYLSRRGPGGWSTINPFPRYCPWDIESGGAGIHMVFFSPLSYERVLATVPEAESCPTSPFVAGAPLPSSNLYRFDYTTSPPTVNLLSPEQSFVQGASGPIGGSGRRSEAARSPVVMSAASREQSSRRLVKTTDPASSLTRIATPSNSQSAADIGTTHQITSAVARPEPCERFKRSAASLRLSSNAPQAGWVQSAHLRKD